MHAESGMDGNLSPELPSRQTFLSRSGSHNERSRRLQSENDFLRDRVISFEKGLISLYKVLHPPEKHHKGLTHHRSASFSRSRSPDSVPRMASTSALAAEARRGESPFPKHVTIPELKETFEQVVKERDDLLSKMDDLSQIAEAAKRERLLAIEEKDMLVKEAHDSKTATERAESIVKEIENERSHLTNQIQELEEANEVLHHGSQEARQLQHNFLEERTKLLEEREHVHCELEAVQVERDELFEETVELQASLQQLASEKRKLLLELEWNSKRTSGYESVARKLKEQNEILNGRAHDILPITLKRHTSTQPWGFSIEGGRGSEFFLHDPSIVVTGIVDKSPASTVLRFGDRVLTVNGRDLRNILRKEAADILRTCDHLSITMEIRRCRSQLKTRVQEVKVPGKKIFGFAHESRLFISSVEPRGNASDWLLPGDEILQVMGKSAVNMKSSHLKQLLKSCKDGVTMTIRRLPELEKEQFRQKSPKSSPRQFFPSHSPQRLPNEFPSSSSSSSSAAAVAVNYPVPGTPGSTMSDSSAGYHSLTHSQPSTMSNMLSPNGLEFKRGLTDLEEMEFENSGGQFRSNSDQSGYETDQAAEVPIPGQQQQRLRLSPRATAGFRGHTSEMYSQLRRYTAPTASGSVPVMYGGGGGGGGGEARARAQTTGIQGYGGLYSSLISPGLVPSIPNPFTTQQATPPGQRGSSLPRKVAPPSSGSSYSKLQAISMSADNLDSDFPPPLPPPRRGLGSSREVLRGMCGSRDSHVTTPTTPTYPRPAFSMSSMQQQTHV